MNNGKPTYEEIQKKYCSNSTRYYKFISRLQPLSTYIWDKNIEELVKRRDYNEFNFR